MHQRAEEEFTEYVSLRGPGLARTARFLCAGKSADAEDLLQSALEKTLLRWEKIRDPGARDAYVRTTMVRLLIRQRSRRSSSEIPVPEVPVGPIDDPGNALVQRLDLWTYLAELSPQQRSVIVLRYWEDLTEPEVATALGCSVGSVKTHSSRALQRLRRIFIAHAQND